MRGSAGNRAKHGEGILPDRNFDTDPAELALGLLHQLFVPVLIQKLAVQVEAFHQALGGAQVEVARRDLIDVLFRDHLDHFLKLEQFPGAAGSFVLVLRSDSAYCRQKNYPGDYNPDPFSHDLAPIYPICQLIRRTPITLS